MKIKMGILLLAINIAYCTMPSNHGLMQKLDDLLTLTSTDTWKEFLLEEPEPTIQNEKWVWISSITFKSKEALKLKKLRIQWIGGKITSLSASLFIKKRNELCVIPIEKNLISDGLWDKKNQQIIFYLNEKIIATSNYHLVLSFPQNIEKILKKGQFVLSKKNLTRFRSNIKPTPYTCPLSPS